MVFDTTLFQFIHEFAERNSFLDAIGIFFADYVIYILIIAVIIFIVLDKEWRVRFHKLSLFMLAGILSRGIVVPILKFVIHRQRPYEVFLFKPLIDTLHSFAFPSGHAAFSFAIATVFYLLNKKIGIWMGVLALLIGIARIFVGVHWPLDILTGALIGIASGLLVSQKLGKKYSIQEGNILEKQIDGKEL